MKQSLDFSELSQLFPWKIFTVLVTLFSIYVAYKASVFIPKYACSLSIQIPNLTQIRGPTSEWILREQVYFLGRSHELQVQRRGNIISLTAEHESSLNACTSVKTVSEFIENANQKSSSMLHALRNESIMLEKAFSNLLQSGYQPNKSTDLSKLLERKITIDMALENPELLKYKLVQEAALKPPQRVNFFDTTRLFLCFLGFFLCFIAAFLIGVFEFLFTSGR